MVTFDIEDLKKCSDSFKSFVICSAIKISILSFEKIIQCAAVMTYLGWIMAPPQKGFVIPLLDFN